MVEKHTDNQGHRTVVDLLEDVKRRPGVWLHGESADALVNFLTGMNAALQLQGIECGYDAHFELAAAQRGWRPMRTDPQAMREKGLDERAIVEERLTIEIDAWKRRLGQEGE